MEAKVEWQGKMSFTGSAETDFEIPLGADPAVGGDNDGFRPLELMAISLAGCTAMDVISILQKKRQQVKGFEVKVNTDRAETHPKVFTRAVIEYHLSGEDLSEDAVIRSIELSATKYCPAQNMLNQVLPIIMEYFLYDGAEEPKLITQGEYIPAEG